jgi:hypothetical protein
MKGYRSVKLRGLVVLAGIVLSCSAVVRVDTLQVVDVLPMIGIQPYTVTITFDGNTANNKIFKPCRPDESGLACRA